jgi:hypothetical protein
MNTAQHQNPDHFLRRLDRLVGAELDVAKFLFQHRDLVLLLLDRVAVPSACSRVVVSLSERVDGPRVVLSREGWFITILGEGMTTNPHETIAVAHDVLLTAMIDHDTQHCLAWVIQEVQPHAARIARAHDDGQVALVVLEVHPAAAEAARALGWQGGRCEYLPLNRSRAERLALALSPREQRGRPEAEHTSAWLRGRRRGRVFVMVESALIALNYRAPSEFTIEPGTIARDGLVHRPTAALLAGRYVGRAKMGRGS